MPPDLREARFVLRLRARGPATNWENRREAVAEAWRGGARAASERLARLGEERGSLALDANTARTAAARRGLDRALDERRAECEAISASPELRRYQEAREAELAARTELAAAAPSEWREYQTRLAKLREQHPRQWEKYEAEERTAGRDPVTPRPWESLFGARGGAPPSSDSSS